MNRFALLLFFCSVASTLPAFADESSDNPPVLKMASTHPIKYYLSLPQTYARSPGKRWPVLICIDGASSDFEAMAERYRRCRGDLPYLIVSPCTFSNTNALEGETARKYHRLYSDDIFATQQSRIDWDEAGLLAIIKDLQADYDAEERVYMTGLSGGGLATYMMIFRHPDLLAGAAPASANFFNFGFGACKDRFGPEDRNFPIHQLTGGMDQYRYEIPRRPRLMSPRKAAFLIGGAALGLSGLYWLFQRRARGPLVILVCGLSLLLVLHLARKREPSGIESQTRAATKMLRAFGYPNVRRTHIHFAGHSAFPEEVQATFQPYWSGEKRRDDPLR